jgi:metal-responsive CopG/Arc/MetJ family transcriptional regulator
MERLSVRIEKDLLEKLEGYVKIKGYNRSAIVRRALYEFLKKKEVS